MSTFDDDVLKELLALERSYDDLPAGAEDRILAGVEALVDGGAGGGSNGGGNDNDGGGPAHAPDPVATASKISPWLARAAYVALGSVAGAAGHAVVDARAPAPIAVSPVASLPAVATANASDSIPTLGIDALPSAPSGATRTSPPPAPHRSEVSVAEERAGLDVARAALARGRVDAALAALERHARTYGEGHFGEERDALAIQALVAAGRTDEASTRARRFFVKYPASLFTSAIEQSLRTDGGN